MKKIPTDLRNRLEILKLVEKIYDDTSMMSNSPSLRDQWSLYLTTVDILKKIKHLEEKNFGFDFKPLSQRNDHSIKKLTEWASSNGAILNKVKVHQFEDGEYGMKASEHIEVGNKLVTVPRPLMITEENIRSSKMWKLHSQDMLLRNMPNVALAIFILYECLQVDSKSFWHPYLTSLPVKYSTPLYFNTDDLEALKGSPTFEAALKLNISIFRQYAYCKKLFIRSLDPVLNDKFTYEYYRWAVSTLMSRQNLIPDFANPAEKVIALIPLWDMFNHRSGKLSTEYERSDDTVVCYADGEYAADEQVFIFYGVRTNADFLVHNGFVYADNEHDAVKIHLGMSRSDPLYSLRCRLLQTLSLPASVDFYLKPGHAPFDGKLLAFVRIFNMDQKTLENWIQLEEKHCLNLMQLDATLEPTLEMKCWKFLQVRINLLMRQYPTLSENMNELSKFKKLANMQMESELNILKNAEQFVEEHLTSILKS